MLIRDAKIGDRVKIAIDSYGTFQYDADGSKIRGGEYAIVTFLGPSSKSSYVDLGWMEGADCAPSGSMADNEASYKCKGQFKKLNKTSYIFNDVQCELVSPVKTTKSSAPFLLGLLGAGAILSSLGQTNNKNIKVREARND